MLRGRTSNQLTGRKQSGKKSEGLKVRDARKKERASGWRIFFVCFSQSKRKLFFSDVNEEVSEY